MRKLGLIALGGCLLLLALPTLGWACSCSGAGCTATADTCPDGCYAVCGSGGCSAGCVGGGGPRVKGTINLSVQGISATELQERLGDSLGKQKLLFISSDPAAPFSVEFRQMGPQDVLKALSKHGAVALLDSTPGDKGARPFARPLSLMAEEIEAGIVARLLQDVLGAGAVVQADDPTSPVSLDLRGATVRDLQSVLWKIARIRVNATWD